MFSNVPLPKTVADTEAGGGFATAMKGMNALTQQNMQNRLLQAQGNLAQQQANFTPYSQLMTVLGNKELWMSPEGRTLGANLIKQLPEMLQRGYGGGGGGGNNNLNSLNSASLGQMILQKLQGNGNGSNNAMNGASRGAMPITNADNTSTYQANGDNVRGTQQDIDNAANGNPQNIGGAPATPGSIAAQQNSGGLDTQPNPIQTQETNAENVKANVLGQTGNQTAEQKQSNETINRLSSGGVAALKALKGWKKNYDESTYKGQHLGTFPTSGIKSIPNLPGHNNSPEQLAEGFGNQVLQITTEMSGQPGAMTDDARALLSGAKGLSLSLDKDAAKVMYDTKKASLERLIQSRQFSDNFFKNNPTATQEQLVAMMNNYNQSAPSYDYENQKPLPENDKKYKDFTSAKALHSYMKDGEYNPYPEKSSSGSVSPQPNINGQNNTKPNSSHNEPPKYSPAVKKLAETLQIPSSVKNSTDFKKWKESITDPAIHEAIKYKWGR